MEKPLCYHKMRSESVYFRHHSREKGKIKTFIHRSYGKLSGETSLLKFRKGTYIKIIWPENTQFLIESTFSAWYAGKKDKGFFTTIGSRISSVMHSAETQQTPLPTLIRFLIGTLLFLVVRTSSNPKQIIIMISPVLNKTTACS